MIYLKQLSEKDGWDVFEMLKDIGPFEYSFTNPVYDMSFQQFKEWLRQQELWALGKELPDGYVPQRIYWMVDNDVPVGIGKIRMCLTPASRKNGGNIGYAVSRAHRGKGYGKKLLELLLTEARSLKLEEILLTVDRNNLRSKKVCEDNGGIIIEQNADRWFFSF